MSLRRRFAVALIASPLLVGWAVGQEAPAISPAEAAVMDFEDIKGWKGVEADTEIFATGKQSGRWTIGPESTRVRTVKMPEDVSWAEAVSLRLHLEEADPGASIALLINSENEATEGADYWQATIRTDFSGWRTIEIPLVGMRATRTPAGWDKITSITLASDGYGIASWLPAGTVMNVDDIRFLSGRDRDTVSPAEFVATLSFEDYRAWEGLRPDSEQPRGGEYCGRWDDMATNDRVRARSFPTDVSPYEGFTMWVNAAGATPVEFAVILLSENDGVDGPDYYQHTVKTQGTGWQKVTVPFSTMRTMRSPAGLDKITGLRLAATGYGLKNTPPPGAMVKLDDFAFLPKK